MSNSFVGDEDSPPNRHDLGSNDFTEEMDWEEVPEHIDHEILSEHENDDSVVNDERSHALKEKQCPYIGKGLEFTSQEEAWVTYLAYAKCKGFGIRKDSTFKSKRDQNLTIGRTFVCEKEGKSRAKNVSQNTSTKHIRDLRTGCKARLRLSLVQNTGLWRVGVFDDNHNHPLSSPNRVGNHRAHKRFHRTPVVKSIITQLHDEGIPNAIITKVVNAGAENEDETITAQQCHDQVREQRKSNIGSECLSIIRHFEEKTKNDPMFFFSMEVDEDRTLRSVFWADGRSRKSYLEFHDVVCFDVTYRTNKFSLPFAPFTGVNHHMQSTLFGCALLADEKEETFVWLFTEWLKCMFGKAPGAIITDQDHAICAAIKRVFPSSRHRYCSWHVHNHATDNLGLLHACNAELSVDYKIWLNSETIQESERLWELLISKYGSAKLSWLVNMYEKRKHWVPAYLRDIFTAGMKSSQRSESINKFFDGYVHAMTPLNEFVLQYDKALKARRRAEKAEDFATLNTKPRCESGLYWEGQAAMWYTKKIFALFYSEFVASQSYYKRKVNKLAAKTEYLVGRDDNNIKNWRIVTLDLFEGVKFTCSCAKFETEGLLCRHIMAIMRIKQIKFIPDQYILRRWTINARYSVEGVVPETNSRSGVALVTPIMLFCLQGKHQKLVKEAAISMELYKSYDEWLDTQLAEMTKKKLDVDDNQAASSQCLPDTCTSSGPFSNIVVRDPTQAVRTKGRPRASSRIKSGKELAQEAKVKESRQKKCRGCGELGHNITTCPTRSANELNGTGV